MKFNKPSLTLQKQLNHIESFYNIQINDRKKALHYLKHCNYYKLRGYWLYYEKKGIKATFEDVIKLYEFDKKLRDILLSYIEKIENSIKSIFANYLTTRYNNSHIHLDKSIFDNEKYHQESIIKLKESFIKSDEVYINHFKEKYEEELPPLWVCVEFMTFGELSKWIRNLNIKDTKQIAKEYNIKSPKVFSSILYHFTEVRNRCAHHSRIWNHNFIHKFEIPKQYKKFCHQKNLNYHTHYSS
ncbi:MULTISPECIES: Abi family protein [unclassified Nitratiruptor]|uniref:Abi family protein n=1 Tax=unclassified Nitratiruptor TaxID=2624044 RepID=UPI0019166574|nr:MULTISPECIES: Abi family protein [unclassified Nitratiruptor]BCD59483.1 abortive infection bacteriophage resistance protein [Nitratiruptor sp. YY08-10]BCD63407.1 abortive infection bacteriophage resistance protein [Nitratiruptor sp. YY08-14]